MCRAPQRAVPLEHLRWITQLPLTSGDGHRVYVHAGLLPDTAFTGQSEEVCLWIRERFLRAQPHQFDCHIVHGHTPVWEGKPDAGTPELLVHRTNLDLAAYATNSLGVGVFDSDVAGGPLKVMIVERAADGARKVRSVRSGPRNRGRLGFIARPRRA